MSFFASELLTPESGDSLLWAHCQHCRSRKDCPYFTNLAMRRAAQQGQAAAQLLTDKAGEFLETVSQAEDVCCLLRAEEAMEQTLCQALTAEMTAMRELCAQTAKHSL